MKTQTWKQVLLLLLVFLAGVSSEYLGFWDPIKSLKYEFRKLIESDIRSDEYFENNNGLIQQAFTDPLANVELLNPPAVSVEQISEYLDMMLVDLAQYPTAYSSLIVTGEVIEAGILKVTYELGQSRVAYAYLNPSPNENTNCAVLIIPGSGLNQSTAIRDHDTKNYHGNIAGVAEGYCDTYIYVKPNEDFLAIHDDTSKLSGNYIYAYLLNKGSSYSASYLIDTMAIVKNLRLDYYDQVIVVGLSQGGNAALYNSLQTEPSGAIISSGYSILFDELLESSLDQILIPGINNLYSHDQILNLIEDNRTDYLFTYGQDEQGYYGLEAHNMGTCNFFRVDEDVECFVHPNRHAFPLDRIDEFLKELTKQ